MVERACMGLAGKRVLFWLFGGPFSAPPACQTSPGRWWAGPSEACFPLQVRGARAVHDGAWLLVHTVDRIADCWPGVL